MDSVRNRKQPQFLPMAGITAAQSAPDISQNNRSGSKRRMEAAAHQSLEMSWPHKILCRSVQKTLFASLPVLPYRDPEILASIEEIAPALKRQNVSRVLVIADPALTGGPVFAEIRRTLSDAGIEMVLFDEVRPNPTTGSVLKAAKIFNGRRCEAMIAYGGGSSMDLAKACGASLVHPDRPLSSLAGILKVIHKTPYLIAIPSTAGTGSETTLAAVLVDEKTRHKFAINDFPLIPDAAVLDDRCVHELPSFLAAQTGMDALCHAVEAYIGLSVTRQTGKWALEAVSLIFENIDGYVNHSSFAAERRMLMASHLAGKAFTRSYVGYIHALSHALSGQYNLPHGKTNATLMPVVLREYGSAIFPALSRLAKAAGLQEDPYESDRDLAEKFIEAIEALNERYGIPAVIPEIELKDLRLLAHNAAKEANPLYPVPVLFTEARLRDIYLKVLG